MERHLWTKNPQSHFWFWWRHTSIEIFSFMWIWNLLSSTNCRPLGLITWRHHPEISCDEHKCTWKPGNMVERHLWTKNPQLFFIRKMLFRKIGFFVQKIQFYQKNAFWIFRKKNYVDFLSTNDAPPYSRFVDFLSTIHRKGLRSALKCIK